VLSEQIVRSVTAEPFAQSNRIEQMFGEMMAAQASSTQLLTKESNQDKEVTPLVPRLAHPYPHLMCTSYGKSSPTAGGYYKYWSWHENASA
jgi:hypothetical protein